MQSLFSLCLIIIMVTVTDIRVLAAPDSSYSNLEQQLAQNNIKYSAIKENGEFVQEVLEFKEEGKDVKMVFNSVEGIVKTINIYKNNNLERVVECPKPILNVTGLVQKTEEGARSNMIYNGRPYVPFYYVSSWSGNLTIERMVLSDIITALSICGGIVGGTVGVVAGVAGVFLSRFVEGGYSTNDRWTGQYTTNKYWSYPTDGGELIWLTKMNMVLSNGYGTDTQIMETWNNPI